MKISPASSGGGRDEAGTIRRRADDGRGRGRLWHRLLTMPCRMLVSRMSHVDDSESHAADAYAGCG